MIIADCVIACRKTVSNLKDQQFQVTVAAVSLIFTSHSLHLFSNLSSIEIFTKVLVKDFNTFASHSISMSEIGKFKLSTIMIWTVDQKLA
jgi:transketolase N-terminal domain/subunit